MTDKKNPLIEPENYFAGYQESIEKMKNNPQLIEWDKLCFELFEVNPQGKKFLEIVTERYLIPAIAKPGTATYQLDVMWSEGFKDFGRMLLSAIRTHQHRIAAGANNG